MPLLLHSLRRYLRCKRRKDKDSDDESAEEGTPFRESGENIEQELLPSEKREMRQLRQFSLLLWKDWVLLRRNKKWTVFELIIPCLLLGPLVYFVVKNANWNSSTENVYEQFKLTGTVEDVFLEYNFMKPVYRRWCLRSDVILGYTWKDPADKEVVDNIMRKLSDRYQNSKLKLSVKSEDNESRLMTVLRDDMPERNDTYCVINSYIGGVVFDTVDLARKQLRYRILIGKAREEYWRLTDMNTNLYGPDSRHGRIPTSPPYWSSAYLTLQHAIESSFSSSVQSGFTDHPILFRGLPDPKYRTNSVAAFISVFPFIFAFFTFINVIHTTRQIAAENATVKPYLTAMGLSTFMFYAAHVTMAFAKFLIIFVFSIIPLITVLQFVSPAALVLTVLMYGLGAVIFGALVASFFSNTNSAIKAILISWGAMIVLSYKFRPEIDHIAECFVYGLNINGAFALAVASISDYMSRERELNLMNMFNDSSIHFSLGWALVMMIVDIIWMSIAALLVDHIRTSADFSLRALLSRGDRLEEYENQTDGVTAYNTRVNEQVRNRVRRSDMEMNTMGTSSLSPPNNDSDALLEGATEVDGARDTARADISVNRLVKVWSTTGERAVDGLSLRAVRGQCSILLGHNGAGKSTTFASIAGIIHPTHGHISICGHDVGREPRETRKHIGMCPQYNPLYDKLTVSEHLQLIHGLKGASKGEFRDEMKRLLADVKLDDKENEMSMNLSGGMKRKLCVCMAMIGDSEVVLLDEPTAGMDPGARQDVQKLVEREKTNRTILLTTHYMDEAERLGDWVFIMSHGRLVASGTNQYLKQKFGTGYLLTVVLDHSGDKRRMAEVLTLVCKHFVAGAEKGEMHGQQIEIILPEAEKHTFVPLFKALEAIQARNFRSEALASLPNELISQLAILVMKSFGLSLNTLEQVFITIGDKVDKVIASRQNSRTSRGNNSSNSLKPPGYDTQSSTKSSDSYQKLMESQARGPEKSGFGRIIAQVISIFRKKFLYSYRNWTQLFGQVIIPIILLGLIASLTSWKSNNSDQYRSMSASQLEPTKVVWRFDESSTPEEARNLENVVKRYAGFDVRKYDDSLSLLNITQKLIGEIPAASFGMTKSEQSSEVETLFNMRYYHILPILVSMVNRARLAGNSSSDVEIESGILLYLKSTTDENILPSQVIDVILGPMLILIFAMVTSTFVMFLIEERTCQFAHQQLLTGISPITFYSASLLYDAIFYSLICLIFLVIFTGFQWMTGHLKIVIAFWILYFVASVPFIYAVSFLFQSPSKANVLLIIWQVVMSGAAMIVVNLIPVIFNVDPAMLSSLRAAFLILLPSFAFGSAIMTINTFGLLMTDSELMEWNNCGENAVLMAAFGAFAFALFVTLQFKFVKQFVSQLWTIRRSANNYVQPVMGDLPLCPSVEEEKDKVHTENTQNYALVVKDLTKTFGKHVALNELCLAVDQKECFGLLGVNGAGKTTTFNILTGQSFATSGDATIGGRDVTEQIPIGYCPQFDALLLDLTGRECLEILAQMHGFIDYRDKAELILECVGMQAHADKLVRFYSGGQKRKISVGVALLAPTQMIILDEPTAGIDPKARREVWELLLWCREHSNSALMLTSHSMDECEALCSRIAVLNRGMLIAIGTSQDLKSLYGNSYTMTLTLNSAEQRETIVQLVCERIPNSVLKTTETNKTLNLKWQIPKEKGDCWSAKFEMVQRLARDLGVKDFILAQSSLEETFLRLAGLDGEDQVDAPHVTNVTRV